MNFFEPNVGPLEAQAMYDAVIGKHLVDGSCRARFAQALKARFQLPNVILLDNGFNATFLTLKALGIGAGDEVITTPYMGVWAVNAILMVGATPVFADVDYKTYNLRPDAAAARLSAQTKAVLPVSINGVPCDLQGFREAFPKRICIISDDIEALGSTRQGRFVGEDIGRDVSIGGFWVNKQLTTCSGGMVVSEDTELLDRIEKLARHGNGLKANMWVQNFGYHMWMSDPIAAMGEVQVHRFTETQAAISAARQLLMRRFSDCLKQTPAPGDTASLFAFIIELPRNVDKLAYCGNMEKRGIPIRPYFNDVQDAPHVKRFLKYPYCPMASSLAQKTVALPMHHKLTEEMVDQIREAHDHVLSL